MGVLLRPALVPRAGSTSSPAVPTYYAATTGSASNPGTQASPWDWPSVIAGGPHGELTSPPSGAVVYVRGGTYGPSAFSVGAGLAGRNPKGPFDPTGKIHICGFPGETVVIQNSLAIPQGVAGGDVWWWDLTIANIDSTASNIIGVDAHAPRHGFIRVIVRDSSGDGFGGWIEGPDCFWLQTAAFNNGFTGSDPSSSFGHGWYLENQTGFKRVWGGIGFNNFGYNYHHYASGNSFLTGGDFRSCGACAPSRGNPGNSGYNFLFGGGPPLVGFVADQLMSMAPTAASESLCASIGYTSDQTINHDASVTNSFFDGKVQVEWFDGAVLVFTGNQVGDSLVVDFVGASATFGAGSNVDSNAYNYVDAFDPFAQSKAGVFTTADTITAWRTVIANGFESHSTLTANPTLGQAIAVWSNPLDPGQGVVHIKNPSGASTVAVDVSPVLPLGAQYSIYHQHSLTASPVLTGTYEGGTLAFPLDPALSPPAMVGGALRSATPVDSRPFAGMYWIRS